MSTTGSDQEKQMERVRRFLASVIRNAELDAERVAALLTLQGVAPQSSSKKIAEPAGLPTGPAADMLLNLAAALRLRSWEGAGILGRLSSEFPTSVDALAAAARCGAQSPPAHIERTHIPREVFRALLDDFSEDGQMHLGTDVLRETPPNDELIEHLAAFLWSQRQFINQLRKERTNHGSTDEESR